MENSYGDCKDKHTLLAAMLQAVGIEASPAIISSVHQVDRDVPSPAQFDHVITAVHRGKDLVWLDTTTEVAPFGMLLANLRDKDALLISSDGSASWVKTPQNPPYELFDNFRAEASLSEAGEMKAEMQDEVRSDGEVALRGAFHYVAQPQWKDLMQRISYGMGYAGTVSDVTADPPEKTAGPFHFTYKYDRTDLEEWINNKRILMPSPPMGVPDLNNEYEKSGEPVRLGTPIKLDYISDVKFPAGYSVQLPQNVDVVTDFAEYHSQYSLKDGQIHSERKLIVLAKEVPATQYAKYRDFVHKVSDDYGTWITLTSSSGGSTSSSESASPAFNWPPIPDNDAGHEMRDGISLLQNRNVPEGLAKLEEAAQRDPKLPGVWDMIASAHFMKGDVEGALDNMRRQTTETPDLAIAFKALATTLLRLQKNAEAVPVARRWMELAPEDRDALTNYGSALMASKQYSQVVDLYEKAVKQDPHRTAYQFRLATAYLELGQNERALQGYRDAIDTALTKDEPENDAAYNLAEKNLNLDQAEEWAKNAVRETEQQTQNLSLDKLESRNLRLMDQLSAYWDTLGWVYFRKGEYTKAEPYLRSSWWLRQSSVVGEHLAQVYEKLHQSIQASRFRQLAEVTPDRRGQVLTPEQAMQAMKTFKSTWKGGEWDARGELGKMRTFHVPVTGKSSESAEFFVLLSAGGANPITGATPGTSTTRSAAPTSKPEIAAVKFISGASSLRKAESGLEHADLALRLPANTNVKLLRRGILMCSPYTNGCDFTLMTVESVRSLN